MHEFHGLLTEVVGYDALAEGLFLSATRRLSLISALVATGMVDVARLESFLVAAREPAVPVVAELEPVRRLVDALPANLCQHLLALPVGQDVVTGTIDVAVVDGSDVHAADEIAYWLNAPVRVVRAPLGVMSAALRQLAAPHQAHEDPRRGKLPSESEEESRSSGVPTQRGPFQQSAGAEEAASTKRGH
ncbi:MAG TPA: hypothetical protein VEK07_21445 [Polyangiaceae bacterium]|nr:hypothetical protein [Polyangiaceae bacterium]